MLSLCRSIFSWSVIHLFIVVQFLPYGGLQAGLVRYSNASVCAPDPKVWKFSWGLFNANQRLASEWYLIILERAMYKLTIFCLRIIGPLQMLNDVSPNFSCDMEHYKGFKTEMTEHCKSCQYSFVIYISAHLNSWHWPCPQRRVWPQDL